MNQMHRKEARSDGPSKPEPRYTVFVRLPFARDEFIDPPQVGPGLFLMERLWLRVTKYFTR